MLSNPPIVSVVMPAYNHGRHIAASMRSVAEQTFRDIELVVVDDGSPDDTLQVARETSATLSIPVKILTKTNGGVSSALNAGVAASSGKFIAVIASDDRFLPEKIERQVALIEATGPRCGLVHCNALEDDGSGNISPSRGGFVPAEGDCFMALVAREVTAIAPSVLFRREAFDAVGGFDENLAGEDYDFYAGVSAHGYSFRYDSEPMIIKKVVKGSLATRVDLLHRDPFITLQKYADRIDPAEFIRMENGFYGGMGSAAAGSGQIRLSFMLYRSLASRKHSILPLVEWTVRSFRYYILRLVGDHARRRLRNLRNTYMIAKI
jgi:glycosyltransferase involved in cell wall biosynthesis